ncbi:MAG: hypothetical protein P0Y59_10380 [Candidatus Sphingomonas phytovorans]|nr:hypothetical protein [Sphingomonas sp.]WEK02057.1 MAG: hypothetical protein P0Y59_10380 [Sphingomonas sp.]
MARPQPPLWLTAPTRFAALKRPTARIVLALFAILLVASLSALVSPGPPPVSHDPAQRADDEADVVLYETIVAGVRGGGDYYAVTAQALRTGNYPLRPFVTFRLPTLATVQAAMPPGATILLLYVLAAAVMLAWFIRLRPAFARAPPLAIAMVLLAGGMMAFVQPALASFHEVWAGLLIALSLALRRRERWVEAVAFGLIAMLVRETAALFVGIMAVLALVEGRRREAIGWGLAILALAVVVLFHAHAVSLVVRSIDPASPGWAGMLGFGFFVKTMSLSTALNLAPMWLAALLVALALFGWAGWNDELALRALATFATYAVLLSLFGRPDTFYWGLMIAPTILVGLAFVPDALRDLATAAIDRRRIIVTRMVR